MGSEVPKTTNEMEKLPHELSRKPDVLGVAGAAFYRLHALRGNRWTGSAIVKAVESADQNKPGTQATSLTILDKVSRFCHLDPVALN
ncbi:unnamed protein product [Clonostachys solani]|uniref:Uncharacterized protein n=1 Tax=Clonostachys solani TaxID=160281 RepID=A0A9N9Z9L3_9HYPO|nr:unnamed protein product [Clonostachys solani]